MKELRLGIVDDENPPEFGVPNITARDIFEGTASRLPDKPAIYYFDSPITYGELDRLADSFAVALQNLGVNRGDRVAILLQNVPQFAIAEYGAWKTGATAVPLNPMFRERELEYHLNDSGSSVLVCLESLYIPAVKNVWRRTKIRQVVTTCELEFLSERMTVPKILQSAKKQTFEETLDLQELLTSNSGKIPESVELSPNDIALLHYTSGTTGVPKGAMNTHRNVVANATAYAKWFGLSENDVVVGVAPLFHITGTVAHLAIAACTGIPLILFYRFDIDEMLRLIEKWKGSFLAAAITVFIATLNHPGLAERKLESLTKLASGGAPVPPAIIEEFERRRGTYIHNVYGLTETTSPSHAVPFGKRAPTDKDTGALAVGIPFVNTRARIMDLETGSRELPPGEVGEVVIKGPQVIPGYWNKLEESKRTIRDGWLYTGDVGKMDEEGWFYIVDRKKDLIVASGYKVWPREVEDVLYEHPSVREVAVVGVPDPYRGENVKAFVVLKEAYEVRITGEELIEFCRQRLAAYKYPRIVEFVKEVPKTLTGKIQRRLLRESKDH